VGLESVGTPLSWACFSVIILAMLALDLGVFHKQAHVVSLRESAIFSVIWVTLALLFNTYVYVSFGREHALEFSTGYLIEKALALDNIFVFVVIFRALRVPAAYQHRVLYWGVFGALLLRAAFIWAGGAFIQHFHWAEYVFGAILVVTGVRLLLQGEDASQPVDNPVVKAFKRFLPVTPDFVADRFTVVRERRLHATPLLLALVAVEVSDIIFAVDSIPAIFAVTTDPFIVFTSNIFAILGLRSLYFLLAGVIDRFVYLKLGLALVLMFVGVKMSIAEWFDVPIVASLLVIVGVVGGSIVASLLKSTHAPSANTNADTSHV
jgi:tellurite resistance protein TerC